MKCEVVDTSNKKVGEIELDSSVFAAPVKEHLHWEVIRMQLASRRRGTHSTKTVSEVNQSMKKPYKQKGTGQARHGLKRAMNMRGGGIVFGPKPRDYSYRMPKKMVQGALRSALSLRFGQNAVKVVRGWTPSNPKTKEAVKVLSNLQANKPLIVGSKDSDKLWLSLRNLPKAKFLPVDGINVYDILYYDQLIIEEGVLVPLMERLHAEKSRKEQETSKGASRK